ncbi:MAG TPA: nucleoid-associated protein [Flavobacteriales bacterium]|nr:nucleoid-associated protein [Flavobacteriales bacterium]
MINILGARLKKMSIHYVGNKHNDEDLTISKKQVNIDKSFLLILEAALLTRFATTSEEYKFTHHNALRYNETYVTMQEIFGGETPFHKASQNLAKQLYEKSVHPKIKGGELYVCEFSEVEFDGKILDAIGIFKTEERHGIYEVERGEENFALRYTHGIELSKFAKGCLVLNTHEKQGYKVFMLDNAGKGEEAQYWRDDFLGLAQVANGFYQTAQLMDMTKTYLTKQMNEEFEVPRADQIDLMNRSAEYFKMNPTFDKKEFEKEVLQDTGIIKSFRKYDEYYQQEHDVEIPDSFDMSTAAVKKKSKIFKSVLKLDRNFHVYIHGDRNMIEQGVDKDGRKFYKIYFEQER